ncbi:MAG: hypothetical protein SFU85_02285 [Candidatus Methylacidiphilales bacterium]|nr:hypothetical protein [Candidatus Methylacidiphilales bacterium]
MSRLRPVDRAGRKALRIWAESQGFIWDHDDFTARWSAQEQLGGAEHHVYFDETTNRWFKRLYHGVNDSLLGEYLVRMRLHNLLFPETAYRLEGFSIHPKSKDLAPVLSQPHVRIDMEKPPVTKEEINDLMAAIGFAPVQLKYGDTIDDGYFAYYEPHTGVLSHDLHDENVVRMEETGELAVIDPYISLARRGSWAALKLAEVGIEFPEDDPL